MTIRCALVLALAAASACVRATDEPLPFDAAQHALRRGAVDEALSHVDRGLGAVVNPDSPDAHTLRLLRAEILVVRPDLSAAAALIEAPIPDRPEFAPVRARRQYLQARLQVARGQLKPALATLDGIADRDADRTVRLDAEVLAGQALLRLGRGDEAEARLKAILDEAQQLGDRYRTALALNNLGMRFVNQGRFDQALAWFMRVLALTELGQMSVYGVSLTNAGLCYARLGDFQQAVDIQQRAVSLQQGRGAPGPYEQALGELGNTYLLHDRIDEAVVHLDKALATAAAANLTNDAAVWARNLAVAHIQNGQWDEAERANAEARRLTGAEGARRLIFNTLNEAQIAAGRGKREEAERRYRELLQTASGEPTVLWAAHEGLALLARDAKNPAGAIEHLDAALAIIERTRSDLLKADYRLSFVTRLIRFYRVYVDLLVERGDIERALMVADSSRSRVLSERHAVAVPAPGRPQFRKLAAASGRILASYWLTPAQSYLWTVTPQGVRIHTLPPSAEIDRLVREHQSAIHDALADPLAAGSAGEQLSRILVGPMSDALAQSRSVVVVPDGALHGLNFETLPATGVPRRYLIEDVEVQIAPSLALLGRPGDALSARSLLVVGNPTPHNPDFPALRYASAEMSSIARHFDGAASRIYQGEQASPSEFRGARPEQFSFVHFTAHATANRESPLDSAVILSGPDDAFKLYARDVADLPLRAELVTVSACRGAGERVYAGEGLVGFAWAFLRAGARRVIAGLWDVDDRSTADLMDAMYARLAAGDTPPQALRAAKLALMARGGIVAKPYYWGPFQVFTVTVN